MILKEDVRRFMRGIRISASSGCWEWKKAKTGPRYGMFPFGNSYVYAHRFSYELFKSPIPDGLFVCHSCDNPKCVNPFHLWLGTAQENVQDCIDKGRRFRSRKKVR